MNVIWHNSRGYWDQALLEDILPLDSVHFMGFDAAPKEGAIVVLPARHCAEQVDYLNAELSKLPWVVLVLTGDEDMVFPIELIQHPRIRVWVQTPHPVRHAGYRALPNGYPTPLREHSEWSGERYYDWSFAGQVTHPTRVACVWALRQMPNGLLHETQGFAQGMEPEAYYDVMRVSRVVPCPSGPCTPDSFRLSEALELGCVPIVDEVPGNRPGYPRGYWDVVMPGHPFPVIEDWAQLPQVMEQVLSNWTEKSTECMAWWQNYKRALANNLMEDVKWLSQ